ncbi:MAG: hypothetical protein AB7O97_23245 [Planctomycetota bacterium]
MATLVDRSLALLRAPGNALGYCLRRHLRWSRGDAALPHEPKDYGFGWLEPADRPRAAARAQELRRRYDLDELWSRSTALCWAENLALLDGLERLLGATALPLGPDGVRRVTDVGCGVFQYATALQRFCRGAGAAGASRVVLRGVEVDGHGVYRDGHSRADHARAHAALAGDDVRFEVADFCGMRLPAQDVVTLLYPFLTRYALLRWGLPLALFRPRELLARAAATLRPGGLLVVANQTAAEFVRLCELLRPLPLQLQGTAPFASELVPYADRTRDRAASFWLRLDGDGDASPGRAAL